LRDVKRFFKLNVKINAKLNLPSKRHTFWRRYQTSHQNTMMTTILACIIHTLVTNVGEDESNISLFQGQLRSGSVPTIKTLNLEEWRTIMLYVLTKSFLKCNHTYSKFSANI